MEVVRKSIPCLERNSLQFWFPPAFMSASCLSVQESIVTLRTKEIWVPRPLMMMMTMQQGKEFASVLRKKRQTLVTFTSSGLTGVFHCSPNKTMCPGSPRPTQDSQRNSRCIPSFHSVSRSYACLPAACDASLPSLRKKASDVWMRGTNEAALAQYYRYRPGK